MSYKKLRPKVIKVMGKDYHIRFIATTPIAHENLGQCDHKKMMIAIEEDQVPVEELDTVIHEILHAIWYQMSIGEGPMEEEPIVRRTANGLLQVILDNPALLKYASAIKNLPLEEYHV
jgi:hypothetical protein